MRETCTSGSEGGGTLTRPLYPYPSSALRAEQHETTWGSEWAIRSVRREQPRANPERKRGLSIPPELQLSPAPSNLLEQRGEYKGDLKKSGVGGWGNAETLKAEIPARRDCIPLAARAGVGRRCSRVQGLEGLKKSRVVIARAFETGRSRLGLRRG